jgi:hypothetical protein
MRGSKTIIFISVKQESYRMINLEISISHLIKLMMIVETLANTLIMRKLKKNQLPSLEELLILYELRIRICILYMTMWATCQGCLNRHIFYSALNHLIVLVLKILTEEIIFTIGQATIMMQATSMTIRVKSLRRIIAKLNLYILRMQLRRSKVRLTHLWEGLHSSFWRNLDTWS